MLQRWLTAAVCGFVLSSAAGLTAADLEFGFARLDITPDAPLRLSGYGNRAVPSEGVDTPLYVRAMAMRADGGPVHVLLSVDTIGFPGTLTQEILELAEPKYGLSRARFVACGTHSHTTPHIARGLNNLFATPLTDAEQSASTAYTDHVRDRCVEAIGAAMSDLKPGRLQFTQGVVRFARNRRVLKDGIWTGFGENANGPTDHSLPLLVITSADGQQVRGLVYNYACHCTTFGGEYNRVNGDWAGYASEYLEAAHSGAIALCTIGCGADQNPQRDRERAFDIAQMQGHEIASEVDRLLTGSPLPVTAAPWASFGFAGLPIDRPTVDQLRAKLMDKSPQVRRHAEEMLAVHARMGRLPETYPMPIQVWRFGDELAMVFLGGEVCVDYAHRIRKELATSLAAANPDGPSRVWVTAYANDVFGYIAPERMRAEGGYEVDFSMIYYLQPGRWSTGTEEVILRRVHELFRQQGGDEPLAVEDALKTFHLPPGWQIEVVAAEPLINDPVNFAVDARGRLWVVEMGDYPRGKVDERGRTPDVQAGRQPWDGPPGGRIRVLTDDDGDGRYDHATTFLDGLVFPTGVFPWRDGAIVANAPDIIFARDTDGDGRADEREALFTGFIESNPQHRVNGFDYGLDGWLYLGSGASSGEITALRTGQKVNVSGRDSRIDPDRGVIEPVSGRSQYGRCRDDFGNNFGNTNSEPLFQFVIEDRQLQRNPLVASPSPRQFLTTPPGAPPVYPTSRTTDRFNDLHAANRFTSACSPCAFRDNYLGEELARSVLICEPVHNLVSRVVVHHNGIPLVGARAPTEQSAEFLSSTDQWFRPVRLMSAPDRTLWVCDMYRQTIEHPQWIPEAWQARLRLNAGYDRGRIYRVRRDAPAEKIPNLDALAPRELVSHLESPNGWTRDTAQRLILERGDRQDAQLVAALQRVARTAQTPASRIQALWTLSLFHPPVLQDESLREAFLGSDHPEVVIHGLRVFGLPDSGLSRSRLLALAEHPEIRVRYELALAAGDSADPQARLQVLSRLVADCEDPWMRAAVLSSANGIAAELLPQLLQQTSGGSGPTGLLDGLIATALGSQPERGVADFLLAVLAPVDRTQPLTDWQASAIASCLDSLERRKLSLDQLSHGEDQRLRDALARTAVRIDEARRLSAAGDTPAPLRAATARLLGHQSAQRGDDLRTLARLLAPQVPPEVQAAAIDRLAGLKESQPLIAALSRLGPRQQAHLETALVQQPGLAKELLTAVKAGQVAPNALAAATRSTLLNHRDSSIRQLAAECFGPVQSTTPAELSRRIEAVLACRGASSRGRLVFEKRCTSCHRLDGLGTEDIGPQLSPLRAKPADYLLTAILDVNQAVDPRFRSCIIVTTDGRQQSGLVLEETATSITLATADGKRQSVLRGDIDDMILTGLSFMPEGLDRDLTPQDLADLVAFLRQEE